MIQNKCFVCSKAEGRMQLAHIIGNRKVNKRMYGSHVISSILNVLPACDLHCNSLIDLGSHEILKERVALIIESDITAEEKRESIEAIVRENINRKEKKNERRSGL